MSIEVRNLTRRFGATVACDNLNLKPAEWIGWKADSANYEEDYDAPPLLFQGDPRKPLLRIPNRAYAAAYLLALADTTAGTTNVVSFRLGRYSGYGIYHDASGEIVRS